MHGHLNVKKIQLYSNKIVILLGYIFIACLCVSVSVCVFVCVCVCV